MTDRLPLKNQGGVPQVFTGKDTVPVKFGGTGSSDYRHKGFVLGNRTDKFVTVRCVFDAKIDPTPNNSRDGGYEVGSRWINVVNDTEWVCVDRTSKNAVWIKTGQDGGVDTFRYYASLVDFEYDYQDYSWSTDGDKNVVTIDYEFELSSVAQMIITYNSDNQPTLITMDYATGPDKTITLDYDDDGYLDTMTRA